MNKPPEINKSFSFSAQDLEEAFAEIFSKAILRDGNYWIMNPDYKGDIPDVSLDDAQAAADGMNWIEDNIGSRSGSHLNHEKSGMATRGPKEFVTCVFKGMIPGAMIAAMDWNAVYFWIKQHSWEKLLKYVMKHAVKYGIKDLAKFTPGGLAVSLLATAVGYAIWG